ncbi:MAG: hypothetical protein KJ645_06100 [Planctomycetes bacterium]|nr:hypothetical protein [Planctomycetota bacterium]
MKTKKSPAEDETQNTAEMIQDFSKGVSTFPKKRSFPLPVSDVTVIKCQNVCKFCGCSADDQQAVEAGSTTSYESIRQGGFEQSGSFNASASIFIQPDQASPGWDDL